MTNPEEARGVSTPAIRRTLTAVLDGERVGAASVSVTFLSAAKMRALNRRTFGRDNATDVIAFSLPHPGRMVGDIYICPAVARRSARERRVPDGEELIRLVVHGILHVVGRDHPEAGKRSTAPMWKVQEQYMQALLGLARQ